MKKRILLTVTGLLAIGLRFGANFAPARTADSLDPTFGTGGTVTTTSTGVAITPIGALGQTNGDIVGLSGCAFVEGFGTQIALTQYTSDESGLC
jgi:hypothetical protein